MLAKWKTTLKNLISEDNMEGDDLVEKLKSQDVKLSKENRNFPRKGFLVIVKRIFILKIEVENNLKIKEDEMTRHAKIDDVSIPVLV